MGGSLLSPGKPSPSCPRSRPPRRPAQADSSTAASDWREGLAGAGSVRRQACSAIAGDTRSSRERDRPRSGAQVPLSRGPRAIRQWWPDLSAGRRSHCGQPCRSETGPRGRSGGERLRSVLAGRIVPQPHNRRHPPWRRRPRPRNRPLHHRSPQRVNYLGNCAWSGLHVYVAITA